MKPFKVIGKLINLKTQESEMVKFDDISWITRGFVVKDVTHIQVHFLRTKETKLLISIE